MTINEFIKEQAKVRAEAAQTLTEPLIINGIEIVAGCTEHGIQVSYGLEELAKILSCNIQTEDKDDRYDNTAIHRMTYIDVNGTKFYHTQHIKKGTIDNGNS